jgi:hypothetical protein
MKIPTITGVIDRRILVNFTADPEVAMAMIPEPFSPKLINGKAIVGICLIRLKHVRPKGFPAFIGVGSENGAHRVAVQWTENGEIKEGVYIPRRDTSSGFNALVGGRLFPGRHYRARFDVDEHDDSYNLAFTSSDDTVVSINAKLAKNFPQQSIFKDLQTASAFFKGGSSGYSPNAGKYDGLLLKAYRWEVQPLDVLNVRSSFFENETMFPKGSVKFDNALLMTNIEHDWSSLPDKSDK